MKTARVELAFALPAPMERLAAAIEGVRFGFFLDGATGGGRSYLGLDPELVLSAKRLRGTRGLAQITLTPREGAAESHVGRPFDRLRALLAARPSPFGAEPGLRSGAVGYIGYEAGHFIEALPDRGEDPLGLPDLCFGFFDAICALDHATGACAIFGVGRAGERAEAERRAALAAERLRDRLASPPPVAASPDGPHPTLSSRFDEAAYAALVTRARAHILAGDAFEICLTHQLEGAGAIRAHELLLRLRAANPAPYSAYLRAPGCELVSASPERFLSLGLDRVAETRPIKGTRARGETPAQDEANRRALGASEKDRAENLMIVDLARSDLGRVAEIGGVSVPRLLEVEAHPTVFQLVSTVRATLREDVGPVELIEACFPPGSMTGAPKIEAMKIIDALEPVDRGPYSGALGWIDDRGALDLSVVIRSAVIAQGRVAVGTGGAVTADSDPIGEHAEAALKARALARAIAGEAP